MAHTFSPRPARREPGYPNFPRTGEPKDPRALGACLRCDEEACMCDWELCQCGEMRGNQRVHGAGR